jgi:guanosine-3',5'-bis(diphosphate) 3'-pyrophosphohydrolase
MATLERAVELAARAHAGQMDESGNPYILHPLRLMLHFSTGEEQIVAVLHEVVEDCGVGLETLRREGFSDGVVNAVDALTKRGDSETYLEYLKRLSPNPLARRMKKADLEEHADLSRVEIPTEADHQRVAEFHAKLALLAGI